jgi:quercetin 2,3-dioxygenase
MDMTTDPPDRGADGGVPAVTTEPDSVLLPGHDVPLGRYSVVRRLLPHRQRRMVGAWCFVDHFGPVDISGRPGMQIAPHPHTGLQTVTWLADGEILHRDSLGHAQPIRPGQLNVMTSGSGIAHSEQSPPDHPPRMHGLQLWAALPDAVRNGPARFDHHPTVPTQRSGPARVTVVVGGLGAVRSPANVHTDLLAVEVSFDTGGDCDLPVPEGFETGVLVMSGEASVGGHRLTPGSLLYAAPGQGDIAIEVDAPARLFVLGGRPFEEPLVMWWNFVGRPHEEIVAAREDWMAGRRFGSVGGCAGDPLPAPALPNVRLKARDRHGGTT